MTMTDHETNDRRLSAPPAELTFPGAVTEGFVWIPADGDDHFGAEANEDTLYLSGFDALRLRAALRLHDRRLMVRVAPDGRVQFLDTEGLPRAAQGEVAVGGGCLTFRAVRAIQLG